MPDLNPAATVVARQPRGAVKLNGTNIDGWESWEVENNSFRSADTFSVTLAANALPATLDPVEISTATAISVAIFANEAPSDPDRYAPAAADNLIYGMVDDVEFDPVAGTVHLTGRDLTAALIDTRTAENHQNSTSSQVATLLAGRHGLTPVVTSTSTTIGQFYEIDHTDINQEESEWDLLCKLANFEGFDVFVKGHELHFQPKPADDGSRYTIVYTSPSDDVAGPETNTTTLQFSRSLTIAKGVTVEVRSWNSKQKKAFTVAWPKNTKPTKPGQATNATLTYHNSIPGLTQDQALVRAKAIYDQVVSHLMKMTADLPGDRLLTCETIVQVRGTSTAWDATYYPDSVKRSMSIGEGYRMSLSAKTISQDLEASAE